MDSSYDGTYAPQSPDLSGAGGFRPESPDLNNLGSPSFGSFSSPHHSRFPSDHGFGLHQQALYNQHAAMPSIKPEDDDDYMPDAAAAPSKKGRRVKQEPTSAGNVFTHDIAESSHIAKSEDRDPTLGCKLNTSFPVARIKRIMQADEDIGKVAQVTPTVVSRALELFMIKLISAAANQARGPGGPATSKGPKRILSQHLKKAILADDNFDFLTEIVSKVPDAPTKAKKEAAAGSDSEETKPKKRGKKRKDSGDDF